jgi:hypothetical protein
MWPHPDSLLLPPRLVLYLPSYEGQGQQKLEFPEFPEVKKSTLALQAMVITTRRRSRFCLAALVADVCWKIPELNGGFNGKIDLKFIFK